MARLLYIFYISKYVELGDTVSEMEGQDKKKQEKTEGGGDAESNSEGRSEEMCTNDSCEETEADLQINNRKRVPGA